MSQNVQPLLSLTAVNTYIGQSHILQGVDLHVPVGRVTALLGRNGAGKTTTLRTIMGLWRPRSGQIMFDGARLDGLPTHEIAARGVGYVPEHRAIFRDLSVFENLQIAERKRGDLDRALPKLHALFPDLKRFEGRAGRHLSGGQQQMLAIARAMVADNRLMLIDEPSEGLAPIIVGAIVEALKQLKGQMTVLLVEQNFRMAAALADYYCVLDDGHAIRAGEMGELIADTALTARLLGAA